MSNSTDPDPSVVSESPDAIHHAGVIILQNVISLVCETFLYGKSHLLFFQYNSQTREIYS